MFPEIELHMKEGQWLEVRRLAEQWTEIQPASPSGHAYLGYALLRLDRLNEAADALQRATTLDGCFWQAGIMLAQVLDRLMQFEEALEVTERFLKVKPSHPTLLHLRDGLKRSVPEKITESWQKSIHLDWHHVELTNQDLK